MKTHKESILMTDQQFSNLFKVFVIVVTFALTLVASFSAILAFRSNDPCKSKSTHCKCEHRN